MAQIKKLKDTVTSQEFYPVTHKDAVIGLDELENYDDTELRQLIAAKYTKPSTGIPESDLSSDVKTSLGLAKSALQEETYKGTVTDVTLTMPVGFSIKKTGSASKQIDVSFSQDYRLVTPSDVKKWDAAEANVQSDWSETNTESDAFIKNKPSIPTKTSDLTNDSNFITGVSWGEVTGKPTFATVATSGSYNDLTNKPTIPSAVTSETVASWGFTKNTGTYSKPTGGIPKSDLSSDVQTSLGKADTALQSYTEKYTGTYSKPDGGIPKTDLDANVQASLSKADSALQEETYKGTVTSVGLTMPDAFTVAGSPITTEGTLNVTLKSDKYIPSVTDKNNWNAAEANVQANWNETNESSDAFIQNKPTLATVATSGSYNDLTNKPSIPTGFNITVNATDDNVVDLTASGGTNSITIDAKHAKQGPTDGYTSGNETTSISSGITKFKIPQLTVDAYGHVTEAEDEEIAITIPTAINGDKGDSVTAATAGTSSDSNGYTITPITFTVGDDALPAVDVKAKHGYTPVKGVDYFDGKSVSSVTKKSGSGTSGTTDTYSVKVDTTEVGTFDVYQGKDFKYEDFTAEQLAALKGFSPTHSWDGTKLTFTDINGQGAAVDLKGEKGDPGTSVTIKGTKSSVEELPEDSLTNPNMNGDGYIVNGYLYVWDGDSWENVGEIKGPQGDKGEDGKEIVSITSDASQTSGYTETTVTVTYNDNTSNTFKVNAKNGGLDNHTHPFTPEGTNSNTVAGGTVTGSFTGSEVTTGQSTSSVSVSKSDHTHSINASTSTTSVASKSHTHSANAAAAEQSISVATSAHKHTVSVTGDVESSFSGTPATIAKTTTAGESVASSSHTHNVDITGSASSTFTGNEVTSSNNGPSYSYEAGVLTINFGHTHTVTATGNVNTTFTGNAVTSGTPSATTTVASNAHTHSYTPAGTITSSLNNVSATVEASDTNASVTKSDHTHTVAATTSYTDVASTGHVHTMEAATSSENVSKSTHTHTVTAAGSLTDLTFTGTEHTHTFTGTAGVTGNPS